MLVELERNLRTPHFDPALGGWVLSQYADVFAALHDPRLSQVGEISHARIRSDTQAALPPSRLAEWQSQIEPLARSTVAALPSDGPVDLVSEFALPWCTELACIVTGADRKNRPRFTELARQVSAAAADPDDAALKSAAAAANDELERSVPSGAIPMAGAAFVALSQTLPAFLARAWLALLRHPGELSRLRENSDLMPGAIEELLRYAGLARMIRRMAKTVVDLGDVRIAEGERVVLMLHAANRDPKQFPDPNRLDVTRRSAGHVAFGSGSHSCVGASLIRMAAAVATGAFVQRFAAADLREPVEWRGGTGFRVPAALYALPRSRSNRPPRAAGSRS
jgi:cytochrome P450